MAITKIDPSRTKTIRAFYQRDLKRRIRSLKQSVVSLVAVENAFGLGRAFNTRFAHESEARKVFLFQEWFSNEIGEKILPGTLDTIDDAYWTAYVQQAYEKGQGRAFDAVRKKGLQDVKVFGGAKGEFLRTSLSGPVSIERVKALAARNFTELKGFTEAMSQQTSRHLVEGLAQGLGPREVARRMTKEIDSLTKRRALTIARTETVRAHAEGQLDAMENLGVDKIRVAVEWSTAGDDRVCPLCQPLEGVVLSLKEARGILPRHANCRCAFIPANVGESKVGQKRKKLQKRAAFDRSIAKESGKGSILDKKKASAWEGAKKKLKPAPKSILDPTSKPATPFPKDFPDLPLPPRVVVPKVRPPTPKPKPVIPEPIPTAAETKLAEAKSFSDSLKAKSSVTEKVLPDMEILHKQLGKADFDAIPGWAANGNKKSYGGILFDDQGRILLREPKGHFDGYHWTFSKGGIEGGDTVLKTALKEVAEETGHKGQVIGVLDDGFKSKESESHFFIMRSKGFNKKLMDAETASTKWVTYDEAIDLIKQGTNVSGVRRDLNILDRAFSEFDYIAGGIQNPSIAKAMKAGNKKLGAKIKAGKALAKEKKELASALKALEKENAKAAARIRFPEVASPSAPATDFPSMVDLKKVKDLPGSTRPELMRAPEGSQWVVKSTNRGIDAAHLRSEALADDLYRSLGVRVPDSRILSTAEGPTKVARFLDDGQTLKEWQVGKSAARRAKMYKELQDSFVADALFANHDVVGLSLDNILVVKGKPYRIDNGGSLLFRAQGGVKQNFGSTVLELDTLLDPAINPNTANIFSGITKDRIEEQIQEIVAKKAILLSKIDDVSLRDIIESRINYLEGKLKAKVPPTTTMKDIGGHKSRATSRRAEPGLLEDTAERVKTARVNGVNISGDREDIEDLNILAWEEVDNAGKKVTKIQLKVTPEGSTKVENILGIKKKPGAVRSIVDDDEFHDSFLKTAKTLATHSTKNPLKPGSGNPNMATMEIFNTKLKQLKALPSSPMTKHYINIGEKLEDAFVQDLMPDKDLVTKFVKTAEEVKKETAKVNKAFDLSSTPLSFETSTIEKGRITRRNTKKNRGGSLDQYQVTSGNADIKFHPNSGFTDETDGLALQGNLEISIPGEASAKTLEEAFSNLRAIGIDAVAPTAEYEELLYLHRTIHIRNDHKLADYKAIWESSALTDKQKISQIQEWSSKKYGVDFAELKKSGAYNPAGITKTGFGDGYRHWDRWDLTADQIKDRMEGYHLAHRSNAKTPKLIDNILNSGGEFTPTVDRIRKGVPLKGGMSTDSDLATGGASYFFTRITKNKTYRGAVRFKIDNLARQDVISYSQDRYGRISALKDRGSSVDEYLTFAKRNTNETLFKHGLSLLDDIDIIVADDIAERKEILEVFKKHKVTHLNDGRKVSDAVKLVEEVIHR